MRSIRRNGRAGQLAVFDAIGRHAFDSDVDVDVDVIVARRWFGIDQR